MSLDERYGAIVGRGKLIGIAVSPRLVQPAHSTPAGNEKGNRTA
jgi:hypothetical protein